MTRVALVLAVLALTLGTFGYIGGAKIGLGLLGLFLTWSSVVAYSFYEHVPRIWGLSALQDQQVGGAIMMVEQSLVLVTAFTVLFVRMLLQSEEDERRRERLEDAAAIAQRYLRPELAYLAAVGPRATVSELTAPDADEEPAMEKAS